MHPKSIQTTSLLLGAAFAGLAGIAPEAEAATVFTEVTDFSDNITLATDLTSNWTNFVTSGGIAGNITVGSGDYGDYVLINAPAATQVTIPISVTSSVAEPLIWFDVYGSDGSWPTVTVTGSFSDMTPGVTSFGSISFLVPASGQVAIGLYQEGGMGTVIDYTIGATVPEAGSSVLGLAGMAAAALRRRRKDS